MATEPRNTAEPRTSPHESPTTREPAHQRGGNAERAKEREATDKKRLQQEREERAKQMAEREKNRGTPTPTQEELDLIKLGHHPELANDGSGPDPADALNTVTHIGGKERTKKAS